VRFEFESGTVLFCFSFIFVSFGESRLLVSWCAGGRCGMASATRTVAGVGDLVQRTEGGRTGWVLGGRAVGWRRARSAPGTWRLGAQVSWLTLKTKVDSL
jgi:hypothetical protein